MAGARRTGRRSGPGAQGDGGFGRRQHGGGWRVERGARISPDSDPFIPAYQSSSRYISGVTVLSELQASLGDRYAIERELGGGGMSLVFVAVERSLDRRVVIKVLPPELSQSVNADRFRREIATLATLQHPQIVPILAAGTAGALLYYVMPFVTGESLRARLEREGVMRVDAMVRLVAPLARALAFAHREGVVHRDIKPENVLLAEGEPVLADFGIAKVLRDGASHGTLTSAGMSIGTVTYMAPEQVLAEPTIDGRADVYSLGALAWELLAGRPPFEGSAQQVMSAHVVKTAPLVSDVAPSTPLAVAEVLARALAKDPADRFSAEEFATALETAARTSGTGTSPSSSSVGVARDDTRSKTLGKSRTRFVIATCALIAVAGAAWWLSATSAGRADRGEAGATGASAARPGIAVLPFTRIGSEEDAYLAVGIAEELMTQLADVPGLRVAASTTVKAFADSSLTPAELGQRLDVRALVEGSVQRSANQLRVSTRLVDVRDGSTLWSNRYERSTDDLFTVQREIGSAVVAALAPKLGISARAPSDERATTDPAAFDLYLRGRYAMQQRGVDSLRSAVLRFREAIARDSTFARAWAGIAEATALMPIYGGGGWDVHGPQVREAAQRAMALDSTLGAPHVALGTAAKGTGDWQRAEQEFDLALARQPNLGATHQNRAELLYTVGRVEDAVTSLERAAILEPQDAPILSQFAATLAIAGRLDSARRVLDRALARDPRLAFAYWAEMMLHERTGNYRAALVSARRAMALAPLPFFAGLTVRAAHLAGDREAERAARVTLTALGEARGVALARALADVELVSPDSTLARLDQAVTERDPLLWQLPLRLWWFDRVRSASGFARLAQRMQLPPQAMEPLPVPRR